MSILSYCKYLGAMFITLILLSGCGGGGGVNFSINNTSNLGKNWPWPWQTDADFFALKTLSRSVPATGSMSISLIGENGEIEITGETGGDSVTMVAHARVGSDTYADAVLGLDLLEVSLTDASGEIVVQTVQPSVTSGRQYLVDYTITIPAGLQVSVNLTNGHVNVSDMDNSVTVILDNGNVNFSNIYGGVIVNMDNGSLAGDIRLPLNGEAVIATTNGDIDLRIPEITSAELFGRVDNGTIDWNNLAIGDLRSTDTSVRGTLGSGAGLVDLKAVNGNISLTGTSI